MLSKIPAEPTGLPGELGAVRGRECAHDDDGDVGVWALGAEVGKKDPGTT